MNQEIERILTILKDDFQACYELTKTFGNLPNVPGIYAIRHRTEILYIGKAAKIRKRFQGGHNGLVFAFINGLQGVDVRIAAAPVDLKYIRQLEAIEARLLQQVHPPYNVQYPSIED